MIDYSKAPDDLFLRHILWFSNLVGRSSYGFDQQLPLKKGDPIWYAMYRHLPIIWLFTGVDPQT